MSNYLVDIEAIIKLETEKAVMVSVDESEEVIWLPKSQIEVERKGPTSPYATITMPEWLALEKELI